MQWSLVNLNYTICTNNLHSVSDPHKFFFMQIQDPKNVHADPDPRGANTKEEKLHQQMFN